LGIGAGITIDSEPEQEWEECQIKAAFLSKLPSEMGLFETILVRKAQAQHPQLHIARIANSALTLGIPCSAGDIMKVIEMGCENCSIDTEYRLRLDLDRLGKLSYQISPIAPLEGSVKIFWARDILPHSKKATLHSGNVLLRHKVNVRNIYDQAWRMAEDHGGFDALFTNEQGYVTEGGRSSVFVKSGDRWLTPPVAAGLLPGVMRSIILNDPQWNAHEVNLTIDDVQNAKEIMLSNALRGLIPAHF
jgi:para-aminobenzoate synthetase/4-amino-4-deoxychorismate lyase